MLTSLYGTAQNTKCKRGTVVHSHQIKTKGINLLHSSISGLHVYQPGII